MFGALQKSVRRIAVVVLLLASTAQAYADVPPPEPNSGWIGLIIYWIKLILHGEWKTLFGDMFFLVIFFGTIFGAIGLLSLLFKPVEKMIEREREKEKDRRLRQGIIDLPGAKSTFPINAVLLVRGVKSAFGANSEEQQPPAAAAAPAASRAAIRDPWEAARQSVQSDEPSSTVKSEIEVTPAAAAPTARPTIAAPNADTNTATPAEEIEKHTQPPTSPPPAETTKIPSVQAAQPAGNDDRAKPILVDHRSAPAPAPAVAMKSVFISYRRHDSGHITGRIYDRLVKAFGENQVFFDVDSPMLGIDFREHIREKVSSSAVCLAVIGTQWNPVGASGQPRLSEAQDRVRIEIELALERGIPVIPVLVDGAGVPAEKDLPQSIAGLAYRNAARVRYDPDFHRDMDWLVQGIQQHMK